MANVLLVAAAFLALAVLLSIARQR